MPPAYGPASFFLTATASIFSGITDSSRHQPLWRPPPTACLPASETPSVAVLLLMHLHPCLCPLLSQSTKETAETRPPMSHSQRLSRLHLRDSVAGQRGAQGLAEHPAQVNLPK